MSLARHIVFDEDLDRSPSQLLHFEPVSLADKPEFDRAMRGMSDEICDYAFVVQFIWREKFRTEICRHAGTVLTRWQDSAGRVYGFPAGEDLPGLIKTLQAYCAASGEPLRLGPLSESMREKLEQQMPGRFSIEARRDSADYLYSAEKMISLAGQKLHSKRNFVNRFRNANEGRWHFEPFDPDNLDELFAYEAQWYRDNRTSEGDLKAESRAISNLMENSRALQVKGGALRLDGKLIGFSLGTFINPDMFCVHIEKADWNIPGAYPVLTNEVARMYCQNVSLINREDDMGIEGLRKSKLSYRPVKIAMKYIARAL
jgi:hypothetical protein